MAGAVASKVATALRDEQHPKVLLVLAPWAKPAFPGLSVSLLRSILLEEGIECDLFYANLLFSKLLGGDPLYEDQIALGTLAELAFTPYYYEGVVSAEEAAETLHQHFAEFNLGHPGAGIEPYRRLLRAADEFLKQAVSAVRWDHYDIVGFSLMFQQTVASLALAKRIKAQHPDLTVVCGGPSCAEPMGEELLRSFPEVDYVVTGEGDAVIAPLVRHVRATQVEDCDIPGVLWRSDGEVRRSRQASRQFTGLESLPLPDYGPYFEQVEALGLDHFHPILYIEGSRGCWWGQKHHCTFCGIEEMLMTYRSKSADKVIGEIVELSRRHRITSFLSADNILDHRAYKELLPRLRELREEEEYDFTFFFELKANLTREQVRLLRDAGVARVQPGIESFSDHVLKLMDKGCTGIGQLRTLRLFAEFDIQPVWNLIYMNPGERPEDYYEMAKMIPYMHHIPPPSRQNQVQMLLQRFNLYFEQPDRYGIVDVRPQSFYELVFPDPSIDLEKLAYFFQGRHDCHDNERLDAAHAELLDALDQWRAAYHPDSLLQRRGPGFIEIIDRRGGEESNDEDTKLVLEGAHASALIACDSPRAEARVCQDLAEWSPAEAREALDALIERRLVYRNPSGHCLALPLLKERVSPRLASPFDQ